MYLYCCCWQMLYPCRGSALVSFGWEHGAIGTTEFGPKKKTENRKQKISKQMIWSVASCPRLSGSREGGIVLD